MLSKRSSESQITPNKEEKLDHLARTACFTNTATRTRTLLERVRAENAYGLCSAEGNY